MTDYTSCNPKVKAAQPHLEDLLAKLAATTDVETAREIATQFLTQCAMQRTMKQKVDQLSRMTTYRQIVSLCYNTMLSGEGLATTSAT